MATWFDFLLTWNGHWGSRIHFRKRSKLKYLKKNEWDYLWFLVLNHLILGTIYDFLFWTTWFLSGLPDLTSRPPSLVFYWLGFATEVPRIHLGKESKLKYLKKNQWSYLWFFVLGHPNLIWTIQSCQSLARTGCWLTKLNDVAVPKNYLSHFKLFWSKWAPKLVQSCTGDFSEKSEQDKLIWSQIRIFCGTLNISMSDCITITRESISAITHYVNLLPMFWLLLTQSQDFCHSIAIFKQKSEWSVVDFYRRQRSCGKVIFSVVSICQSFCPQGGSHVTITHDTLHCTGSTVQGPKPLPPSARDIWWQRLYTCSNLFTWGPHCTDPPPTRAGGWLCTVGGWIVHTLLEYFLVSF